MFQDNKTFALKWSRIIEAGDGTIVADPSNASTSDLHVLTERADSPCALTWDSGKLIRVDPAVGVYVHIFNAWFPDVLYLST